MEQAVTESIRRFIEKTIPGRVVHTGGNRILKSRAQAYDKDLLSTSEEYESHADSHTGRGLLLNEWNTVHPQTRVICVVDNADYDHVKDMSYGWKPTSQFEGNDRLVRIWDNGIVDIFNLDSGRRVTRYLASPSVIALLKYTYNTYEAPGAPPGEAARVRKDMTALEKKLDFLDAIKFRGRVPDRLIRRVRESDYQGILWHLVDRETYLRVFRPIFVEAGAFDAPVRKSDESPKPDNEKSVGADASSGVKPLEPVD